MFWIVFSFFVLLLAHLGDETVTKAESPRSTYRVLLIFLLAYAIALCGESTDRYGYIWVFENSLHQYHITKVWEWLSIANTETEIGFVIIQKLLYLLGLSGIGFLFVISLTINTIVVNLFYKFRYPVLIFFLYIMSYFYIQQTNVVRQSLAVAIGLLSIKYIIEKDWKRFLLVVFIAFTIHKTSLVLLLFTPFVFIDENNEKRAKVIRYLFWALWGLSLLSIKTGFFSLDRILDYGGTRYDHFVEDDIAVGAKDTEFNFMYNLFVGLYFFAFKQTKHLIYTAFFVTGCVFENLAMSTSVMTRMSLYFSPLYCAFAPTLIAHTKLPISKDKRTITALQTLLFLYYFRKMFQQRIADKYEQIGYHINSILDIFR